MAVLAIEILTFGMSLVKAEDVVVPTAVNNEAAVQTKISCEAMNGLKFNPLTYNLEAESNATDDEINDSRTVISVRTNLEFSGGSNVGQVVAAHILFSRILEALRKSDIILRKCFGGVVGKDNVIKEYEPYMFHELGLCKDLYKIGYESPDGSPLDFFCLASSRIRKGEMEAINALMKNEATRAEILKPITDEEFRNVIDSSVKKLNEKANWWVGTYSLEIKNQIPVDAEIKNGVLCNARDNVEYAKSQYCRLKAASLEGFKAEQEGRLKRYLDCAVKDGTKRYDEDIERLKNIVSNEEELNKSFNEALASAEKAIKESENVLNNPAELNERFEERKAYWNDRVTGYSDRAECCRQNVKILEELKFEDVSAAFKYFSSEKNLKNFEGGFISVDLESAASDKLVEKFGFDGEVGKIKNERNKKYEKVIIQFPQNMHPLVKAILDRLIISRLGYYFSGLDNNLFNPDLELEDGKVYKDDITYFSNVSGLSIIKNLLDGKDVEFSFKCVSNDAANFNSFNEQLPGILKNILINAPITGEDVVKEFAEILGEFKYGYFNELDSIYIYSKERNAEDCELQVGSELNALANLFAPKLCDLLKFDENDKNIKTQYLNNFYSAKIECLKGNTKYRFNNNISGDIDFGLDAKKSLLLNLAGYIKNFDVNSLNNIEQNGDSKLGFENLIANGSCCIRHANIQLEDAIVAGVLNAVNGFINSSPDGFNLKFAPCDNNIPKIVEKINNYSGYSSVALSDGGVIGDISLIKALNKNSAEFEAAKSELELLLELFKFFTNEGNVRNLTPMQKRVFFSTILYIVGSSCSVLDVSVDPFKNEPDLGVNFICNSSAKFVRYIEFLIAAIDEKLASLK